MISNCTFVRRLKNKQNRLLVQCWYSYWMTSTNLMFSASSLVLLACPHSAKFFTLNNATRPWAWINQVFSLYHIFFSHFSSGSVFKEDNGDNYPTLSTMKMHNFYNQSPDRIINHASLLFRNFKLCQSPAILNQFLFVFAFFIFPILASPVHLCV